MKEGLGDFQVGAKLRSQGRTISEGDYSTMVNISWETGALHTDREYMAKTEFKERILGGPCIIPFVAGLSTAPLEKAWDSSGLRPVALVGINNVRFTAPLHPGDTIHIETEVVEFRPTSKEGRYIGRLQDVMYKQDKRVVLQMERIMLLESTS